MRITWAADDCKVGRVVVHQGRPEGEHWILGYGYPEGDHQQKSAMISLRDGMINFFENKDELADYLTDGEYFPVELVTAVTHQSGKD